MGKDFSEAYSRKLRTTKDIMQMVESGDFIVAGQFAGCPQAQNTISLTCPPSAIAST